MTHNEIYRNLISSIILVIGILALHFFLSRTLNKKEELSGEERQKWLYYTRNIRLAIISFGLVFIWAAELKALALSLVAFAIAIIIATKELIQCFLGGLFQTINRPFSIGDRIEVGSYKGDVIDYNFLTTFLLEVGPGKGFNQYTGREISIPNSIYLSNPTLNETSNSKFVLHSFSISLPRITDWRPIETQIIKKASEILDPYRSEAEKALKTFSRRRRFDTSCLDPQVFISFQDFDRTSLTIRLPVPSKDKGKVEQKIIKQINFEGKQPCT